MQKVFIHTYPCSVRYCIELKYVKKVKRIKITILHIKKKRTLINGIVYYKITN